MDEVTGQQASCNSGFERVEWLDVNQRGYFVDQDQQDAVMVVSCANGMMPGGKWPR